MIVNSLTGFGQALTLSAAPQYTHVTLVVMVVIVMVMPLLTLDMFPMLPAPPAHSLCSDRCHGYG